MEIREFVATSVNRIRSDGIAAVSEIWYSLYAGFFWSKVSRLVGGRHVFDHDWDVLVVLDACRADLLREVAGEYAFLEEGASTWSVASTSETWLERTFADAYAETAARTAYVTGNPFSDAVLSPGDVGVLDEVWREAWDEELGTIPPGPLTDRAVSRWRSAPTGIDRMIVHYMQPHFPSIPDPSFGSGIDIDEVGDDWDSVWDRLRNGTASREATWTAYRKNLEHVLGSVGTLLSSIDADRVVVTADHGNSFGSFGIYGHPPAAIPAVRSVPWYATSAEDTGAYEPRSEFAADSFSRTAVSEPTDPTTEEVDQAVEEKLNDLGYL